MLLNARLAGRLARILAGMLLASALGWAGPKRAEAGAILPEVSYATSGTIDAAGVTGLPAVRFIPGDGVTAGGTSFALGAFVVSPPADGSMTRYDHTPFLLAYSTRAIDGTSTAGQDGTAAAPMMIRGWLSGTVGGTSPAALSAQFDQGLQPDDPRFYQPRPLPPFPAGSSIGESDGSSSPGTLSLLGGRSILNLDTTGTPTPIEAQVNLSPSVPEPASWLIYLGIAGAIGTVRYRQHALGRNRS